jgi:hypothetical protein
MRAQLDIVWDGAAPGLAEHELSISALNQSLQLLLMAVRHISAASDPERSGGVRRARGSERIDLRVRTLGHGCLSLGLDVLFPDDPQVPLFGQELVEKTMSNLVDALGAESRGEPRNAAVRKYLRSLEGVTSQSYTARLGGRIVQAVAFDTLVLPPEPEEHPYPREVLGEISGVRFPPAKPEVRLGLPDGSELQLYATASQVERALMLRGRQVLVRVMTSGRGKQRLLALRSADEELRAVLTPDEAGTFVLQRWRETLERLGQ